MGLTQVSTDGVKSNAINTAKIVNGSIQSEDIADNQIITDKILDGAVTLAKLPHGDSNNNGKFLRANNGADPSFESIPAGTTINNNASTKFITGTNNAGELDCEANLEYNNSIVTFANSNFKINKSGSATIGVLETGSNIEGQFRANTDGVLLRSLGNYPLILHTNQTERMRIDSSGNVGIGSTSPQQRLHLHTASSSASNMVFSNTTTGSGGSDGFVVGLDGAERGQIFNQENTDLLFGTNNIERMRILASGNINIPDNGKILLGTGNDLEIYHNSSDTSSYVTHENGTGYLYLQADAIKLRTNSGTNNETYINCNHNTSVDLYYNNEKKFVTTDTGARVENTSSPLTSANSGANEFVVTGDGATGITIHSTNTNQNTTLYFADGDHSTIGGIIYKHSNNQMRFQVDGGLGIQLNPDKTVYFQNSIYASSFESSSDLTHKSNLVPFTNTLDKLKGVNGYTFDMKVGEAKDQTIASAGIIAQDLEKVFPKLVGEIEGYKTVQYNGLIGVLVEAVKELTTRVETLEAA
tara:strand:- start:4981 stop:6561 length:1581 start_codon:yes stop_codon:yes gene_type:complete